MIFNLKYNKILPSKYVVMFLSFVLIFVIVHLSVYVFFTSKILNIPSPYYVGDLSRMSYQVNSTYKRKNKTTLEKLHIDGSKYNKQSKIDIITIGDSFSDGGGGGRNAYYQDYISTIYDKNVLNIQRLSPSNSVYDTVLRLMQSGILNDIKPKALFIESVSRNIIQEFSKDIANFQENKQNIYKQLNTMHKHNLDEYTSKDTSLINTANYKFISNTIKYKFKNCLSNHVCKLKLKQDFFSVKDSDILEFYQDNVTAIPLVTKENIQKVNQTFNQLAKILKEKGIKLYVMIVVDKFDLYSPYLKKNPFGEDRTFELLRNLPKDYTFIDTKKILRKLIKKGKKDIYFADDTHWNYKASKAVIKNTAF